MVFFEVGLQTLSDLLCLRKLVHDPGHQKLPTVDKGVIHTLCGAAWWPCSPGPTLRIQQLGVLTRAPSLTCCGTFYKLLNSRHENKHRHQCPRIDLRESDRAHGRQKLALPFFLTLLRAGSDQAVGYCSLLPNKIGKHKQGTVTRRKCDSWGKDEQNLSKIQELKGKPP